MFIHTVINNQNTITMPLAATYRMIADAQLVYGPKWFKVENFELHGYLAGERVDMIETLSIEHFDEIHFISQSQNAKNLKTFVHAIGVREGNRNTVLILKAKQ